MQNKSEMINRIAELAEENAKLNAIIDSYQPKIQALKDENERLIEEIKEVKKYQYQQEYLDKEIEAHQKSIWTLAEGLNKRQMLLQEIKEIAETSLTDCQGFKCDAMDEILQKITKAEEE